MFDIRQLMGIGKTLKDFSNDLQAARQRKESLQQRKEEIMWAPCAISDVAQALDGWVDRLGKRYLENLQGTVNFLQSSPSRIGDAHEVDGAMRGRGLSPRSTHGQVHATDLDLLLAGIFGDIIKAQLRAKLQSLKWPDESGSPVAQRKGEIELIDAELAKVEEEERKLIESARKAGLSVE